MAVTFYLFLFLILRVIEGEQLRRTVSYRIMVGHSVACNATFEELLPVVCMDKASHLSACCA